MVVRSFDLVTTCSGTRLQSLPCEGTISRSPPKKRLYHLYLVFPLCWNSEIFSSPFPGGQQKCKETDVFHTTCVRKRTAVQQNPLMNQISLGEPGSHLWRCSSWEGNGAALKLEMIPEIVMPRAINRHFQQFSLMLLLILPLLYFFSCDSSISIFFFSLWFFNYSI